MIITTKEKIKQAALTLFAQKGYEGTTMSDIAEVVGINKASIYNHYRGKEDLFLTVYKDVASDYELLNERVIKHAQTLDVPERIQYVFEERVLYYYRKPELQAFWNQITLFTPAAFLKEYWDDILKREEHLQEFMEETFSEGMQRGLIRRDNPYKLMSSFRAMEEGLLNWMIAFPGSEEGLVKEIWVDLWLGMKERGDNFEEGQGI
ncbi:MAG: TetR/AcrR family transcriptional regulator [Firmicutes bacterium]|nr:TetR/AcrR family transcriptional regulator [Bacillota bacterium]